MKNSIKLMLLLAAVSLTSLNAVQRQPSDTPRPLAPSSAAAPQGSVVAAVSATASAVADQTREMLPYATILAVIMHLHAIDLNHADTPDVIREAGMEGAMYEIISEFLTLATSSRVSGTKTGIVVVNEFIKGLNIATLLENSTVSTLLNKLAPMINMLTGRTTATTSFLERAGITRDAMRLMQSLSSLADTAAANIESFLKAIMLTDPTSVIATQSLLETKLIKHII